MGSGAIYRLGAYKDVQGCMGFKLPPQKNMEAHITPISHPFSIT